MKPYVVEDLRDGYVKIVQHVRDHGKVVSPHGFKTWEIEDACFTVTDTTKLLPLGVGRSPNVLIGLGEALLLCGGLGSPSLMTGITDSMRRFIDGGQFHGAYGPRVRGQLESVITRLRGDRDSRQAIVQIWDPAYDGIDGLRDYPCTLNFGFRLRDDELHMSATMRSNDVWLGLAYDAFMFGQLGWTIANVLGVNFGSYTHHAYSLHLYERNADAVENLHSFDVNGYVVEPRGFGYVSEIGGLPDYEFSRKRAETVYRGLEPSSPTSSELLYLESLSDVPRLMRKENFAS